MSQPLMDPGTRQLMVLGELARRARAARERVAEARERAVRASSPSEAQVLMAAREEYRRARRDYRARMSELRQRLEEARAQLKAMRTEGRERLRELRARIAEARTLASARAAMRELKAATTEYRACLTAMRDVSTELYGESPDLAVVHRLAEIVGISPERMRAALRGQHRRLTVEECKEIALRRAAGETLRGLAHDYEVSYRSIIYAAQRGEAELYAEAHGSTARRPADAGSSVLHTSDT